MKREKLAFWLLSQFLREPHDHCQEGRDPSRLLSAPSHLPGKGSPPGSWPRDKPFPTELLIFSSRVILVPKREREKDRDRESERGRERERETGLQGLAQGKQATGEDVPPFSSASHLI